MKEMLLGFLPTTLLILFVVGYLVINGLPENKTLTTTIAPSPTQKPIQIGIPRSTYRGMPCTYDCSGHEAGYEWAERRGITDPDDCGGNSQSFIEGCISYAQEQ